jgi:stage V sporulation protein K
MRLSAAEVFSKADAGKVALNCLYSMPGMKAVKDQVEQMVSLNRIAKMRKDAGLKHQEQSLHMIFTGNPGTGKTTAARLIGQAFAEMGLLKAKQDHIPFVEVHHVDVESSLVGEAEKNIAEKFEKARGGVLFIDEAYAFIGRAKHRSDEKNMAVIVQKMEDLRDEVLVIAAGYPKEMEEFLDFNPGLRSRFSTVIHFPDYRIDELVEIARMMCAERDYSMSEGFASKLRARLEEERGMRGFGNARTVRNIIEQSIRRHAVRVSGLVMPSRKDLTTLHDVDLEWIANKPVQHHSHSHSHSHSLRRTDHMPITITIEASDANEVRQLVLDLADTLANMQAKDIPADTTVSTLQAQAAAAAAPSVPTALAPTPTSAGNPVPPVQTASAPTAGPAPVAQTPAAPTAPPAAAPVAAPTSAPQYDFNQLATATMQLQQAGQNIFEIFQQFGIQALNQLPKERYAEYAALLRQRGAKI